MKLYSSEREIDYYLRKGNPDERINALCSMETKKENYERYLDIYITDINRKVKGNALCGAIHSNPKLIWEIIEYTFKYELHEEFFKLLLKHLLEMHKKEISLVKKNKRDDKKV